MNFKILKRDLKRKKSMNFILLLFILLATTFIASSVNNVLVIMNGTDYFMERAGIQDYLMLTVGGSREVPSETDRDIESFLKEEKQVTQYTVDEVMFFTSGEVVLPPGKKIQLDNYTMLSSFQIQQQKFFDRNNREIKSMEKGTIYLPQKTMIANDLNAGDTIAIHTDNGYHRTFTINGYAKDALMGSDMMGAQRWIISNQDFEEMVLKSGLPYGRLYSVSCKDLEAFEQSNVDAGFSTMFNGGKALIKMTYVMDMVVAAVLLLVSLCLVIISVVMLHFNIVFTVNEDYKEIGIMKAIGIPEESIRRLYLSKYFLMAMVGAVLGLFASIPFGRMLLEQVTQKLVLQEIGGGIGVPFLTSILVVLLVVLFGYHSTRRIKKLTPMDAIRSGNNGERFKRKGLIKLAGQKWRATTFLAGNDCLSEFRKYLVLLITSAVGIWLVIMPVNTINTLCSEQITKWFTVTDCDIYVSNEKKTAQLITSGDRQCFYDYLNQVEEKLKEEGIDVSKVVMEVLFRFNIRHGEDSCQPLVFQGLGTRTEDYFYDKGTAPVQENEIAITRIVSDKIHADIGDTVYLTLGKEERAFVVTAIFQSMNNMGEVIRIPEQVEFDYSDIPAAGSFGAQIILKERPEEKQYKKLLLQIKPLFPDAKIESATSYIQRQIGSISEQMNSLKILILVIVITINILVVVLMQKMFLIRERRQMGMLKAIGFSNSAIISWQTKRIMLILFLGIVLGTVTATPFSQITSGQVFKMMGASKIVFEIRPLEVYVMYPIVLFVATVIACVIVMLRVRRVSIQEINVE